jgi:hypothetical protein
VQRNPRPQTDLGFYGEFDFQGGAQTSNSNESNSYIPRLRHMYGSVDWDDLGLHLLAGQTWSLVTSNSQGITPRNEVPTTTIDGQYIPGFTWTRQPLIRLVQDLPHAVSIGVSLENPQTTFFTGVNAFPSTVHLTFNSPAGQGFDSANTLSLNHVPDVVGKIVYEPIVADRHVHLEPFHLYRSFYERLNFNNQNSSGVGGGLTVQVAPQLLDFPIAALAGKGTGRYGSAQLTDVTFDPDGNIHPIHEIEALAVSTLHVTKTLDYYLFFGEEKESEEAFTLSSGTGPVTTRLICIEGWSATGKWGGTPMASFQQRVGADTTAKYVLFECADDYSTSIDMPTVLHRQTLLTVTYDGQPHPPELPILTQVVIGRIKVTTGSAAADRCGSTNWRKAPMLEVL